MPSNNTKSQQEKDLKYNWHPYAQMKELDQFPPPLITHSKGIKLFDESGHYIYDTIASWWCNVHGHAHPKITQAIASQAETLPHVMFGGLTHNPAINLSETLVNITPDTLTRVFYSDNGSCAIEVALKMSFQYWQHQNKPEKQAVLYLENGYHGDTLGTMSVSGVDVFHGTFSPWLFKAHAMPVPLTHPTLDSPVPISVDQAITTLEAHLKAHHHTTAAMVVEPLAQCAGGMRFYSPEYLSALSALTTTYNVHLIADEIATGFGRTGKMWACDWSGIAPDFMCVSKGLPSGPLPIAATLTTSQIYEAFYGDYHDHKTFYHGHTFTANPIACAAANASIALFAEEDTLKNVAQLSTSLNQHIHQLAAHPNFKNPRAFGAIAAIDIIDAKTNAPFPDSHRIPRLLYQAGLKHHVMLRPLGNTMYIFPPLCTTVSELEVIMEWIHTTINEVFGQ